MISPLESKIIDVNCEANGISAEKLMENAGGALYDTLCKEFNGKRILIVCGTGNNGGDGFACAKFFGKKAAVAMLLPPDKIKTEAARHHFNALAKKPLMFFDLTLENYDVIVDCVLGTGMRPALEPVYKDYVRRLKSFKGRIVSADMPTGLGTKTAVKPDITVTFHDIKTGMNEENCGKIVIADIGIPSDIVHTVGPGDMLLYPLPKEDSHKGENGKLLVIGGGPYVGAPAMSAMAALRTGVDLVHISTPKRTFLPIASVTPMFIMHETPEDILTEKDVKVLLELSKKVDAVLIGPGLGTDEETMKAVREFVLRCDKPTVVDADGITAISAMAVIPDDVLITPHKKEFEGFSGFAMNSCDFVSVSKKRNAAIVIKGATDVIVHLDKKKINTTGTAAMTVGGTGDVLSGVVAALVSKGMSLFNSGCVGAFICGKAGEYAFDEYSYGMTAIDVIEKIPKVLKAYLR